MPEFGFGVISTNGRWGHGTAEHTAEILGSLGLDRAEIEGLAREGILALAGGKS